MTKATATDSSPQSAESPPSEVEQFAAVAAPIWPAYVIAASICLWLAWRTLPPAYLAGWAAVYAVFMSSRGLIFRHYHSLTHLERIAGEPLWKRRFTLVMLVYGVLQSLLIAVAIPWLPLGSNFLMTWLIFFSCVLVTTVMPLSDVNLRVYIGVTLVPTSVAWLFVQMDYSWLISLGLVAAVAVFLKGGRARLASMGQTWRLATQLAESNALLRRSNVSRTRMVMEASHDLRQPAHALGMMVERLRHATPGPDFEARVGDIESGIFSLSDMLNELMEFSRLDLGEYVPRLEPVNLALMLQEIDRRFFAVAQHKGLAWSVRSLPVWVDSDPWLLRRVINNLVSNALKYTSAGGVEIGCIREGDEVTVFVEDTGPGIAPEHHARVFIEYVRLHNSEADEKGMGIGLAFARRATDALGHHLRLKSAIGKGTRMSVGMHLRAPPAGLPVASPDGKGATTPVLAGRLVLLLENDPMLRKSMGEVLASWEMKVQAFGSVEALDASLRLSGATVPDIILVDLHLDGDANGLQAVARIRAYFGSTSDGHHDGRLQALPIPAILLTGDLSPGIEEQASAMQARVAYKPLRPSRLKSMVGEEIAKATGLRCDDALIRRPGTGFKA